ncbi:MAG: amino acid transporter [archaeon]|nr:amino acid transporter [archaeon]
MVLAVQNITQRDYSDVVEVMLGWNAACVLNIFVIIYSFGHVMSYLTVVYALVGRFIKGIWYYDSTEYLDFDDFKDAKWGEPQFKFPIIFGLAIVLGVICLQRDMKKLNFVGYFGMAANLYAVLVVIIECHSYYTGVYQKQYVDDDEDTHANYWNLGKAFTRDLEFFNCMSTLFNAFSCHTSVYPAFETFRNCKNDIKKMLIATVISCIIEFIFFYACSIPAFLTDPIDPEDLVLYREPKEVSRDIAMNIAKIALALGLFSSIPLFYVSFRASFVKFFFKGALTGRLNIIMSVVTFTISALVASVYDKILHYISYIGGFVDVFFCYLFPILLYIKFNQKGFGYWKNVLELALAIFLCIIGFISGILTIIDDVKGDD